MRRIKVLVCFFTLLSMCQSGADIARFGVFVVDDKTGKALKNVSVMGVFDVNNGWFAVKGSDGPNLDRAVTDVNGRCRLRGRTNCGNVGCWVEKPPSGFYPCPQGWGRRFSEKNLLGIWQPDNQVATIRLQRVERPIPLFI